MKRLLLIIASVLLMTSSAYGQVNLGTSSGATNPQRSGDVMTGLFSSTAGAVSLSSGGTEMMRVNGTGVGIGTTNPLSPLQVDPNITGTIMQIGPPYNGGVSYNTGNKAVYISAWAGSPSLVLCVNNTNCYTQAVNTSGYYSLTDSSSNTILYAKSGNVGIGTTSPANLLDIGTGGGIHITSGTPSSTSNALYNNSGTLTWNGSALATATPSSVILSGGQLQCSGANCSNSTGSGTIQYCPYKGNLKTTASQGNYSIPAACLTATLTSMYVGGVGSTSVAANTLYYIYLWNTSGTWVLDAETTGHATDSTTGIEIKSGDNTKTLVGMIHTDANKKIMTRGFTHVGGDTNTVATWDNRIPTNTQCSFTAQRQVSSSSLTEVNSENRCLFMSWGDAAQLSSRQMLYPPSGASDFVSSVLTIDGTSNYVTYGYMFLNVNTGTAPYTLALPPASFTPSEGYHYTELLASSQSAATITFPFTADVAGYTTLFTIQ